MKHYLVSIEMNGEQVPVGDIAFETANDAVFSYAKEYLERSDAAAISISLPLKAERFSAKQTKTFFSGLLPEGFTRRSVASFILNQAEDPILSPGRVGRNAITARTGHNCNEAASRFVSPK